MATLRNSIGIATDSGLAARLQDQDIAAGMGSLRRGWETGRIGNELNPLRTEALDAELAGNQPLAQSLRGQIDNLQQRQGMYAPTVGRVEDIHGIGDGLSWAAGQVGQGAASMADPMAVSAGLSTAGRIASVLPGAGKLVGLGLQGAALGIPAYMSKRQLTGEFIGEAERDPALMARTSPQSLRDMAGNYGTLAAIPDSFLPGMVGRQISGLSRAGNQAARQATMGAGTKTLLGMGMEGGTEALQSAGSQYARGVLNPERDTSGDFMENVNSFAGGAVGAGPFAAAGAYGEAGHNRIDGGVDAVKDATGSVVDLMNNSPAVQKAKETGGKWWQSGKDAVVDLQASVADENGKITPSSVAGAAKGAVDAGLAKVGRVAAAEEFENALLGQMPQDIAADASPVGIAQQEAWVKSHDERRTAATVSMLETMKDDPNAQELLASINDADPVNRHAALSQAAVYVVDRMEQDSLAEEAGIAKESNAAKVVGALGGLAGRALMSAGRTAVDFGKAAVGGVKEGMARKKNMQTELDLNSIETSDPKSPYDNWLLRTGRNKTTLMGEALSDARSAQIGPAKPDAIKVQQAMEKSYRRAQLFGEKLASRTLRNLSEDIGPYMRDLGYEIADLAESWGMTEGAGQPVSVAPRKQGKGLELNLSNIANSMRVALGKGAIPVLDQLQSLADPKSAPMFDILRGHLQVGATPEAREERKALRATVADQVLMLLPPKQAKAVMDDEGGPEQLLKSLERVGRGHLGREQREAIEKAVGGKEVLNEILTVVGAVVAPEIKVGSIVDDRNQSGEENLDPNADDEGSETSAYEERAAEKMVVKNVGPKVFGFHATKNLRTQDDGRDMFAPTDKPGEDGVAKRPALFKKGQQLFGGKGDALEKKVADIKQQLMEDPAYPDHDNYRVEARSAHDVMKDAKMQPGKVLQLYRDYMHAEYNDEKNPPEQKRYFAQQMRVANNMIKDSLDPSRKLTTPRERKETAAAAEAYFKERFVVVGEQLSNQDPSKITLPEVLAMHKEGQGLIERSRLAEDRAAALSDANVLMFKSDAVKGGELAIPAGKLVKWVKQARGKSTVADAEDTSESFKAKDKDEAYLADVMEGIAALIGSGRVEGMPYKMNQFGQPEHFSLGVADSLRLATKSYGAMKLGEQKRREGQTPKTADELAPNSETQEKVAAEQTVEKSDETEGSIDDPEVSKAPKDGAPDEYANQRWLSRQTDADVSIDRAIGPEPKGTAVSSAEYRAEAITAAFLNDPAKGQEMIRSRIRMAMAPEYTDNKPEFDKVEGRPKLTVPGVAGKDQVVGGVHYIAPVAAFISAKNLAKNNVDLEAKTIQAIQAKVANILLKGQVSDTERVKIARLLVAGTDEKITSFNVKAKLQRIADGVATQGKPIVAKQEVQGPSAEERIAKDDFEGLDSVAKVDKFLKGAYAAWENGSDNRDVQTELNRMFDEGNFASTDLASFYDGLKGGNAELDHESLLKSLKSAPEVAKAGLPKGQLTPSGGRKLNAMAVDIHTDLQRGGFAATHDSPIRHEGKFDWRAHLGKGEGNASFGAGTYLSTSDGVHKSYKGQFTAVATDSKISEALKNDEDYQLLSRALRKEDDGYMALSGATPKYRSIADQLKTRKAEVMRGLGETKSPTYEVSVDIKPEQLLDWNRPLSEQSELVRKALAKEASWRTDKVWNGSKVYELVIGNTSYGTVYDSADTVSGKFVTGGKEYDTLATAQAAALDKASGFTLDGAGVYKGLVQRLGSQAKASDYLQSLGILGHKYAASGGRNDTHPNYVIYDDSKITTNYVHFNNQDARTGNSKVSTQAERDEATAYAKKVLGPKISVAFKDITGYSGEFIDAQNAIEISTTAAAGTLGTLYHEAMHVFFRDFVQGNPRVQTVFESLVNDPKHLAKLHALLDGYPAAQAQLHGPGSGEERLSYTYQFWKAGLLEVDAKAHTWLQKLGKFFRRVAGMVRDSERALELFQAFDNGKMAEPSAAGMVIAKAMAKGMAGLKMRRKMDALFQGLAALTFPSAEILGTSVSPTARKLSTMFFTNPGEEAHGKEEIGLMNARRSVAQQYINVSNRRFETMSETDQAAVQKYLQSEAELTDIPYSEHRAAVKDVRDLLERFHKYMTDSGMKIGKVEKYYPTVWSTQALLSKKQAFTDMLVSKYAKELAPLNGDIEEAADRVWQSLVNKEGVDAHLPTNRDDGVLTPFFASQEMRTLPWLKGEDKEAYLEKDMPLTLTRYFSQGAHATEYFRRFGENGKRLEIMLAAINVELSGAAKEMLRRGEFKDEAARVAWVGRQMRDVTQATGAMEGSLGKDVSPNMRKFNSWMAVYQNIRLLPMALFSSFVDPLSMVARGAPLQAAYETFTYSMREVFRGWADAFKDMPPQRQKDEWRKLSEAIGASEIAMFSNLVSDQYSSTYMTPGAKRINDKMFVFNGMEAWNRGNRIMATKWAVRFIEQHAALPDRHHSARWLTELGLTPAMITKNAEGNLITNRHELAAAKGISLDEATKEIAHIHNAINRWVEGAVLTPNAAQRPSWSSDPNFASMFHLKQFSYSFHQTILKRATNEFKHGNMAPLGALALFVPTMIGADIMKGLIQGAGTLPPYMAGMNAGDWVAHGVQRAGLSGIGVIGMDAATDWASLGGPAFEQIVDAARDGFGSSTALKAAPLHAVYGELVR